MSYEDKGDTTEERLRIAFGIALCLALFALTLFIAALIYLLIRELVMFFVACFVLAV